jgi:ribosome biogenesis GTPase / thiamine phosphate phosphatase
VNLPRPGRVRGRGPDREGPVLAPTEPGGSDLLLGRVAAEHRTGYVLFTDGGERPAEVAGRLRFDADRGLPPGLPAVGDWVEYQPLPGERRAVIHAVRPRTSLLLRKDPGRRTAAQVLAANVDIAFLVSALPGGLNPRRLERYLALVWDGGARPVLVLNKADLAADPDAAIARATAIAPGVPVHAVSAATGLGMTALEPYFAGGAAAVLLGPSGVGKSTLINRLLGRDVQPTQGVRDDGRGRHTTTQRQLFERPGGGWILDTPGLRELALWEGGDGVDTVFAEVEDLAPHCRFRDCTHRAEPGCAVRAAVASGALAPERLANYHKLHGELAYLERRHDAAARAEHNRQVRALHRSVYKHLRHRGRD